MATFDVTFFDVNDRTALLGTADAVGNVTDPSFSTDPAHARPFMLQPDSYDSAEIDFKEGRATVGQLRFKLLDKRTNPSDQSTGIFTALLGDANGETQLIGHRVLVRADSSVVLDGVMTSVSLDNDYVTYSINLRDIRERDRLAKLFPTAAQRDAAGFLVQAPCIIPRGPWASYGFRWPWQGSTPDIEGAQLHPLSGKYDSAKKWITWLGTYLPGGGVVTGPSAYNPLRLKPWQVLTDAMLEAVKPKLRTTGGEGTLDRWNYHGFYPDVSIMWRNPGGAWNEVKNFFQGTLGGAKRKYGIFVVDEEAQYNEGDIKRASKGIKYVSMDGGFGPMPANGATIEFVVVYTGPPTENYPYYLEGYGVQILKEIADGRYFGDIINSATNLTTILPTGPANMQKKNGGFEDQNTAGYGIYNNFPAIVTVTISAVTDTNLPEGRWACAVDVVTPVPNANDARFPNGFGIYAYDLVKNGQFDFKAGVTYEARWKIKAPVGIGITLTATNITRVLNQALLSPTPDFTWKEYIVQFTVAADGTDFIFLGFHEPAGDGTFTVYVDDFRVYAVQPQLVRTNYDVPAMNALDIPWVRGRITKSPENDREWVQENLYKPFGIAPGLNNAGSLSPVRYRLPDVNEILIQLDDGNTDEDGSWEHSQDGAVTVVDMEFVQETYYPDFMDPFMDVSSGDGFVEDPVQFIRKRAGGLSLLGERSVKIKSMMIRDTKHASAPSIELEQQLGIVYNMALQREFEIFDRYQFSAQRYSLLCRRGATGVSGLRTGSWVTLAHTWLPDYAQHKRGLNRLAQIMAVEEVDSAWRRFTVEDAGASATPLAQPVVGTPVAVTNAADGTELASQPITSGPAGARVHVQYAVIQLPSSSPTAPDSNRNDLWLTAGRSTVLPTTIYTPPISPNSRVWFRARSEKAGRRSSAWTTPAFVNVPIRPVLERVWLERDSDGFLVLHWTLRQGDTNTQGVRIGYEAHDGVTIPSFAATVDMFAGAGQYVFSLNQTNVNKEMFSIRVTPYTGWTGSAVSGTAGRPVELNVGLTFATDISVQVVKDLDGLQGYLYFNMSPRTKSVRWQSQLLSSGSLPTITVATTRATGAVFAKPLDPTDNWVTLPALFTGVPGEFQHIIVIPYENDDGTGLEGQPIELDLIFGMNDNPFISWRPKTTLDPEKEAVELIVTDNGDQVALYWRIYDEGTAEGSKPAYTREPTSGFTTDPLVKFIEHTLPGPSDPVPELEAYAVDDTGNRTPKNLKLRFDLDKKPQGDFDLEVDATGKLWLIPNSTDPDTGSLRFHFEKGVVGIEEFIDMEWIDDPSAVGDQSEFGVTSTDFGTRIDTGYVLEDDTKAVYVVMRAFRTTSTLDTTQQVSLQSDPVNKFRTLKGGTGFSLAVASALSLNEPTAGLLAVAFSLEGTQYWEAYEAIGFYPTLDGDPNATPDLNFRRLVNQPGTRRTYEHDAVGGTWYVIIIPYDAKGQPGTRVYGNKAITGVGGGGVLSDLYITEGGAGGNLIVGWSHNTVIEGDIAARYTVDISRNGTVIITGRRANWDPAAGNIIPMQGGHLDTGISTGGSFMDVTYNIRLWDNTLVSFIDYQVWTFGEYSIP